MGIIQEAPAPLFSDLTKAFKWAAPDWETRLPSDGDAAPPEETYPAPCLSLRLAICHLLMYFLHVCDTAFDKDKN